MKKETINQITKIIDFDNSFQGIENKPGMIQFLHTDFILSICEEKQYYSFQIIRNMSDIEFYEMIYIIELKTILESHIEKLVSGYLPIFPGFYGTHFEFDYERMIEQIKNDNNQHYGIPNESINYDKLEINYKKYDNDIAKLCVQYIGDYLKDLNLISNIEFESVYYPREYNFVNNHINVSYEISDDNKKEILKYVINNLQAFDQYIIDTFSSRDGFHSFYSPDFHIWLNSLKQWNFKDTGIQISEILNFILLNEDNESSYNEEILEYFHGNYSEDDYISNYNDIIKGEN